ncbi:DUF6998 domain-containing protein [Frateuria sp. GZRe14]|uniref:DUF6998 domain-containing protein n=1 Tax=Frateuria sp. GZRe14 TaxID=3351534 RepID=UPI003EDBD2C4
MAALTIPGAVVQLLAIVEQLRASYPSKRFTLDGRLVGDIGEILVEQSYALRLHEGLQRHHDGICWAGRNVQIKATLKDSVTFPCDHVPDHYIAVKIRPDGSFDEVFNGPGAVAQRAIAKRKVSKTNLHSISLSALRSLQKTVRQQDQIPRRAELEVVT